MEWGIKLRRTQSLKSLPSSCDKPTWTDSSLRDKKISVSQLVARYQTTVKVSTVMKTTAVDHTEERPAKLLQEKAPSSVETKETHLVSLLRRNEEREWSRAKAGLSKAKSMESLQGSAGSIVALKSMFESKDTTLTRKKDSIGAANFSSTPSADKPVMNGEVEEEIKSAAEEQKALKAMDDVTKIDAKKDPVTRKALNQERVERRRTIAGIDFEKLAAFQTDEKRRSIADFRDSSFIQPKEKLSVSVKAMSALYLSKVAPQDSTNNPVKLEQDQSRETVKRGKPAKMSEESTSQPRKDGLPPSPWGAEDIAGSRSQCSREKFYQKRQKCELKRLLKHTHPELKMLDDVVDEELAEVWSSEKETAGETGYEGEVFSRRLIFENSGLSNTVSPYNTPTMHTAEGGVERCDVRKMSAAFEEPKGRPQAESATGITEADKPCYKPDLNRECEEDMIRIDVQATRKLFESQPGSACRPNSDSDIQGEIYFSVDKTQAVIKENVFKQDNLQSKNTTTNQEEQPQKQSCLPVVGPSTEQDLSTGGDFSDEEFTSFPEPEGYDEIIKTSAALFKNNPFISTNIDRENSFAQSPKTQISTIDGEAGEDHLTANVKNRTHLFESMPFDKIRHQNKDEIQTMVENIEETLDFLFKVNAIHSNGSIIEVNETMIAKKVRFTLSESGPEVSYDEVAEGGAQNFVLHLLPRVNLKPQITYLKEDSKGCMKATIVNVPIQQRQISTNKDAECKTANVAQVVEDILNQDNSLRKGMIIQEDVNNCAEVIVYALYNYFDEEDVKSYSPSQGAEYNEPQAEGGDTGKPYNTEAGRRMTELTNNSLEEASQESVQAKGNVKLFTSCIEKGDLDYLKTLHVKSTVQEEPQSQSTELNPEERGDFPDESSSEWVPVDVKRLKSIFSGDESHILPKEYVRIYSPMKGGEYAELQLQSGEMGKECDGETRQSIIESAKNSLMESSQDQTSSGLPKPEVTSKGNVKLFKSCIDKGDLDYLKTLQAEPTVQEQDHPQDQTVSGQGGELCHEQRPDLAEESSTEWIPVDVKRLKSIFSGNQSQNIEILHREHKQTASWEGAGQVQVKAGPQASKLNFEAHDDRIHQAELVEVIDENYEISNLHNAIQDLQQATIEAKALYNASQEKRRNLTQQTCEEPVVPVPKSSIEPRVEPPSASSGHTSDCHNKNMTGYRAETVEKLGKKDPNSKEVIQKQVFETISTHTSETTPTQQEDEEVVFEGKFKAALESLGKSNINITKGDFKAAMIYRNSSKPPQGKLQNVDVVSSQKLNSKEFCTMTETESTQETLSQKVTQPCAKLPHQTQMKPALGPKPVIPPKPEHLTMKQRNDESNNTIKMKNMKHNEMMSPGPQTLQKTSVPCKDELQQEFFKSNNHSTDQIKNIQGTEVKSKDQGSPVTPECKNTDAPIVTQHHQINVQVDEKSLNVVPVKDNMNESEESHVDFHEACQKFGGKKTPTKKTAPAKPKRVKIAQPVHILTDPLNDSGGQTDDSKEKKERQESVVEMREKKGRTETEDERRQRLSVHMDEIMRGNIPAALEIFDKLRKQEELQSILCRVEEIEQDASEVDVKSLSSVFKNVPDWVVSSVTEEQKKGKEENKEGKSPVLKENPQTKTSMAHIFGDLERASEEIMNLKEQTLARLVDIEDAIKKALYSVSTLKSDSDIAGLSCLFKESLGAVQGSSGNISKISIESSKTKQAKGNVANSGVQGTRTEQTPAKQRASPPSSPAFISIQSAARKTGKADAPPPEPLICHTCQQSPKVEEKFCTTKTLTCNSPAENRRRDPRKKGKKHVSYSQPNQNREVSVLEVQTDHEGKSILGTTTVTENYERTDNSGNRFYSSKTSTIVTTQPETRASSTSHTVMSAATYQVTKYPEVQLPVNKMPKK